MDHVTPERPDSKNRMKTDLKIIVGLLIFCLLALVVLIPERNSRGPARVTQCRNNLKQIVLALHVYQVLHHTFPPPYTVDEQGKPLHSWRILILPYMEQKELYDQIRLDEPWDSPYNRQFHDKMPYYYACVASRGNDNDWRKTMTNFRAVVGPGTFFNKSGLWIRDDLQKSENKRIIIAETTRRVPWMAPEELPVESLDYGIISPAIGVDAIGSLHDVPSKGAVVAFSDGSTEFLPLSKTEKDIWQLKRMCLMPLE